MKVKPTTSTTDIRRQALTLPYLTDVLVAQGVIDRETQRLFVQHEPSERKAFERVRAKGGLKAQVAGDANAAELLVFMAERLGLGLRRFSEEGIVRSVASHLGLRFEKIDTLDLDLDFVASILSHPFARKHLMIPLRTRHGELEVAVADPFDLEGLDSIRRTSGYKVRMVLVTRTDLMRVVREFFGFRRSVVNAAREMAPTLDLGNLEQFVRMKKESEIEVSDQHVVDAVEYLLLHAYDLRASDIHLEPKRERSLVRLRIDGVMHEVQTIPKLVHAAMVARVKVMARMDIAEKRRPQDGRIKTERQGKEIELRVSTLPVAFGEKLVIRIFDPEITASKFEGLGFFPKEQELFESFVAQPHGIVLVTGPTGSGKTTTLYSALRMLADGERNLVTIEDPIEMVTEEFNQTAVNPTIGLTFASALRTLLRQDPDVIMVGEIRDLETAQNAVQAALTGHLVFSSLHTNDAPSSVTRLVDLGVEPFLIAATLVGVMAQRLVRRTCSECAAERALKPEEVELLGLEFPDGKPLLIRTGTGCLRCRGTGYFGRTGIFEVMAVDDALRRLVAGRIDAQALREAARRQGMSTLRECAIRKMLQGLTTLEEVMRVTPEL